MEEMDVLKINDDDDDNQYGEKGITSESRRLVRTIFYGHTCITFVKIIYLKPIHFKIYLLNL